MTLKSPGIEIRETVQTGGSSGPALSVRAAFVGLAEKGPIGKPVLIRNQTEFVSTYGGATVGYLRRAADALWAGGNAPGASAYFVRTAHYTDAGSPATLTAQKAAAILNDRAATPVNTLQVRALTEGTWANRLKITIQDASKEPAARFRLLVVESVAGVDYTRETYEELSMASDDASYVVTVINGKSKWITVTDKASTNAAPANRPVAATTPVTGGNDGLLGLTDADYVGSSAGRTGLYALNVVQGRLLVAVPGIATKTVADGLLGWCASRGGAFAYLDCPIGADDRAAVAYREQTLQASSSYGELLWPNVVVRNGAAEAEVPISPFRIAAQIRTDEQMGGSHQIASGAIYGPVYGYLRPASDAWQDQGVRDSLHLAQINTLNIINNAVVFWGANTLDTTGTFPYSNERRTFQEAETRVRDNVSIDLFRNNDESLWLSLSRKIENELLPMWRAGALRGASAEEAFAIKIDAETNPADSVARGEVRGKIGLSTQRPGLFFYFDFYKQI